MKTRNSTIDNGDNNVRSKNKYLIIFSNNDNKHPPIHHNHNHNHNLPIPQFVCIKHNNDGASYSEKKNMPTTTTASTTTTLKKSKSLDFCTIIAGRSKTDASHFDSRASRFSRETYSAYIDCEV
eukprot:jgi/Psemu1/34811/gm1.34811_g